MKSYSVTTVLKPFTDFSFVPEDVLIAASERGQIVHAACASYALKQFALDPPEDCRGFFESFKRWFDRYVKEVIFVETRMENEALGYNGMPDLGCVMVDDIAKIVDYKTPVALARSWELQTSAYCALAKKEYGIDFVPMSLRLKRDGGEAQAKDYEYSDRAYCAFLGILNGYRYLKA